MATAFLYAPIRDWQTRVLGIRKGIFDQPIQADLHVVDLITSEGVVVHDSQERIQYTALSYCWGSSKFDCYVACNESDMPVTSNLYAALQRVRSQDCTVYIWVDAVCINQSDDGERSRQVQEMVSIYAKAEQVIVWLGDVYMEVRMTRLIESTPRIHRAERDHVRQARSSPTEGHIRLLRDWQIFASNPYFTRIWVKQEIWAARRALVYSGPDIVDWNVLYDTMRQAADLCSLYATHTCPQENIGNIVTGFRRKSWHSYRPHPDQSIFTLLELSVQCHCTDMKDRVYGLLGMSMDVDHSTQDCLAAQKLLTIDYGRTVSQIFENVARYNILRSSSLEVLALSGTFGSTCSEISLPSWVPDWRAKHDYLRVWEWSHHRELRNEERDRVLDSPEGQLNIQARRLGQLVTCVRSSHNDQEVLATFETDLDYLHAYYTPDDEGNLLCQQHDGTHGRNMPLWTRFMPKAMWWQLLSEIPRQWKLPDFVHGGDVLAIVKSCPGVVILRPDTHHPRYRYVGYVDLSQSFAGVSRESIQAMRLFLAEAQKYDDAFPSDFEDFTLV